MVDKIKRNIVEDSAVTEPKIAANSVEAATLNVTAITGLSEVTDVADTDKLIISDTSDSGNLKKINKSRTTGLTAPTFTSVSPDNSQTADGGNITFTITGTGFTAGSNARLISNTGVRLNFDTVVRASTTSITGTIARSSLLVAQSPYDIQIINGEGVALTAANKISIDTVPLYVTSAGTLGTFTEGDSIDVTVTARDPDSSSAITFELQSGSLPAGLSLVNQSGDSCRITGTASAVSADTTSNFTLRAFDSASNTVSRAFSITIKNFTMNSARFNSDDSDNLSKTLGTATNRRKWTYSFWTKPSDPTYGGTMVPFSAGSDSNNRGLIYFNGGSSELQYLEVTGGVVKTQLATTRLFRDPSAFYHIVLAVDYTQATDTNRIKLYVNGTQETSFTTSTYAAQDYDPNINNAVAHSIGGANSYGGSLYYDGYISQAVFVDGSQLAPTSFGETDSNGVWIPKAISGLTFGNNGFNLDFADAADLGDDESGNGNDFAENNITSIDKSADTPLNNFATFNPLAPMVHDLEEGNLRIDATTTDWDSSFSTIGASSGKWYFEMKFLALHGGLRRAAMGLVDARDQTLMATNEVGYNITGTVGDSVGYNGNGTSNTIKKNDTGQYNGTEWSVNDIICMAVDLDNHAVYFRVNDSAWLNSGDPTSGASKTGAVTITSGETYVFGATAYGADTELQFNFGAPSFAISSSNSDANGHGSFEYAVPTGYFSLNTKNLAQYG